MERFNKTLFGMYVHLSLLKLNKTMDGLEIRWMFVFYKNSVCILIYTQIFQTCYLLSRRASPW